VTGRWVAAVAAVLLSLVTLQAIGPQGSPSPPLSLVLLCDVSASVDFRQLELPHDVSREIDGDLRSRLTPADRLGIAVFGATMKFGGFLPDDRGVRLSAIQAAFKDRSVGLNGPSRIWDAVDGSIAALERESGRRAVILLTDGYASGNRLGLADVIRHAQAAKVAVTVIASGGWVAWPATAPGPTPRNALERLTADTGGMLVLDNVGDSFRARHPGRFFEAILASLRRPGA
jgi:von Willebrand factor type A domain